MGRPKKNTVDTVRGSFIIPIEIHKSLSRLARHKGLAFNEFLCTILDEFVKRNAPVLKILDDTDKKIAELENTSANSKAGDDVAEN